MKDLKAPFVGISDTELIRVAPNDPAAFEELFERHASLLQRWLYAQTHDMTACRELLAESFAQAWRSAPRFRGEDDRSGSSWLYGIARRLVLQHYKRCRVETSARRRLGMVTIVDDEGGIDEITSRLDAEQLSAGVREAFDDLTYEQRQAIGYRVIDELSYEEVAVELGISPTTARTRVFRGLQTMRATIKGVQP